MRHLWAILLILAAAVLFGISGAGVAQTSDPQPRATSDDGGPPPGGCNPIGVTVSGEMVFPMTCKEFIERYKAADRASTAAEPKPVAAEASKAPAAAEAGKAQTTGEANRSPASADGGGAPAVAEAGKAPTPAEAPTGSDVSSAPAAVEASKASAAASKAPAAADAGKPDEKEIKPAAAKAPADEAASPVT